MQAIIIVMFLTYTSLYKIIKISLKTIGCRQLVKPSRYRNTMYTCRPIKVGHGVRSSTANTYVRIRNIRRPRCRVFGKNRTWWFVDCQYLSMDIRTIRQPRCRVFGSVAKSVPPDSKGCGDINVEHYVSQTKYYRTSHPEPQQIIPHVQRLLISKSIKCDLYKTPNCLLNELKLSDMRICCGSLFHRRANLLKFIYCACTVFVMFK